MAVQEELVEDQRRVHRAEYWIDELENELIFAPFAWKTSACSCISRATTSTHAGSVL